jgi:hypothetical protein
MNTHHRTEREGKYISDCCGAETFEVVPHETVICTKCSFECEPILESELQPLAEEKDTAPEEWKKKIKDLFRLLHAVGSFTNSGDEGEQPYREELFAAYDAICQWRHDKPYLDDEIEALLQARDERAVKILERLKVNLSGTEWEWFGEELNGDIDKVITAIRANRSERREE